LWDLDGTVIDSEPAWFAVEQALVERHGGVWTAEDGMRLVGSDLRGTAAALQAAGVGLETNALVNLLLEGVADRMSAEPPWCPGVLDALQACREAGLACALVSMSWRRFTLAVADLLPGAFQAVVSGDDLEFGKPHPQAYLTGAAKLGLSPAECVAVEDSPTGVGSSMAAGVPTVVLRGRVDVPGRAGLVKVDGAGHITAAWLRRVHRQLLGELAGAAAGAQPPTPPA
jgi:HAD superfamily hydrolase (TIGR01509 family)